MRKKPSLSSTTTASPVEEPTVAPSPEPVPSVVPPTATPSPLATIPPRSYLPNSHSNLSTSDRAYDLVGGTWTCRTFANTPLSHHFGRDEDAVSLIVETSIKVGSRTASLKEHYHYHVTTGHWSVSLADGQFVATAPSWTGSTWTFSGIDSEGGRATEATMIYKLINDDSFTRTFLRIENDGSVTRSGEQCLRVSS